MKVNTNDEEEQALLELMTHITTMMIAYDTEGWDPAKAGHMTSDFLAEFKIMKMLRNNLVIEEEQAMAEVYGWVKDLLEQSYQQAYNNVVERKMSEFSEIKGNA